VGCSTWGVIVLPLLETWCRVDVQRGVDVQCGIDVQRGVDVQNRVLNVALRGVLLYNVASMFDTTWGVQHGVECSTWGGCSTWGAVQDDFAWQCGVDVQRGVFNGEGEGDGDLTFPCSTSVSACRDFTFNGNS
jgi:hypothetical protein